MMDGFDTDPIEVPLWGGGLGMLKSFHLGVQAGFAMASLLPIRVDKVIHNGPATIAMWSDGTKTVVKAREGDEYDGRIGLLMCCLRKAMWNRRYDKYEQLVDITASMLREPDEMRRFAEALVMMADTIELEELKED